MPERPRYAESACPDGLERRSSTRRFASACSAEAWDFSRAEEVWTRLAPLTPRGRDRKEDRAVYGEEPILESLYDQVEAAIEILERLEGPALDRLRHRLSRVPRLPEALDAGSSLEAADLFLVKKFLVNYAAAVGLLDARARAAFSLGFESGELRALLARGGSDEESFFVSDAYDPALAAVRARARELDASLARMRGDAESSAERELGLAFRGRSFIVVPVGEAARLDGPARAAVAVEPYDSSRCVLRLSLAPEAVRAEAEREGLLDEERALEAAVVERLSDDVASEAARLRSYEDALGDFDFALARALLARDLGLTRPAFRPGSLVVRKGRLLPCEDERKGDGLGYRPLDLELGERAAMVFGPNMGGKTVALQTALSLQVLAQAGLFVPAERFESEVHARIVYAGAPRPGKAEPGREGDGLSGFGREVEALQSAWEAARAAGAFVVLDELGRTTSSREAAALVAAAAERFAAATGTRCLLATHFRGACPSEAVARLRMAGLDREAARAAAAGGRLGGKDRLRAIAQLMRYEIVRDDGIEAAKGSDALEVAALLGLDEDIMKAAQAHYDRES